MTPRPALLVLAAALPAAAPAFAQDEAPVELEPMQVGPRADPLWADREHLRKLIEAQPCLGCDEEVRKALARLFAEYVAAKAKVPDPSFEERREARVANDWRAAEWGPEMENFR